MAPRGFRRISKGFKKVGRGIRNMFSRQTPSSKSPTTTVPPNPPHGALAKDPANETAKERRRRKSLQKKLKEEEKKKKKKGQSSKKGNDNGGGGNDKGGGPVPDSGPGPSGSRGDKRGGNGGQNGGGEGGRRSNGDQTDPQFPGSHFLRDRGGLLGKKKKGNRDAQEPGLEVQEEHAGEEDGDQGSRGHEQCPSQKPRVSGHNPYRTLKAAKSDEGSGLSGDAKQETPPDPPFHATISREPLLYPPQGTPTHDHLSQIQSNVVPLSAVDPSARALSSSNSQPPLPLTEGAGNNVTPGVGFDSGRHDSQPRTPAHPNAAGIRTSGSIRSNLLRSAEEIDWLQRRVRERERIRQKEELAEPEQQARDGQGLRHSVVEDNSKPAAQDTIHPTGEASPKREPSQSIDESDDEDVSQKSGSSRKSKSSRTSISWETNDHPGKDNHMRTDRLPRGGAGYGIGSAGGQDAGGDPVQGAKSTTKNDQDSLQIDGGLPFHGVIERLGTTSRADENWSQVCTAVNVEVRLTEDNYPVVQSGTKIPECLNWSDACKTYDKEDLQDNHGLMRLQDLILAAHGYMAGFRVFLDIQSNLNADKVLEHLCRELDGVVDDVISRDLIVICLPELRYLPFVEKLQGYTVVLNCLNLNTAQQAIDTDTSTPIHVKLKYSMKINKFEGEGILKLKSKANDRHRDVYIEPIDDETQIKWFIRADVAGIITRRPYDLDKWYKENEDGKEKWVREPEF